MSLAIQPHMSPAVMPARSAIENAMPAPMTGTMRPSAPSPPPIQ